MHQSKMSKYIPPNKRVVEEPTTDVTSVTIFPSLHVFSPPGSIYRTNLDFKKAIEETTNTVIEISTEKPVIASHPLTKMRVFEMTNQEYFAAKNDVIEIVVDTPKIYYHYALPIFIEDDDEIQEYDENQENQENQEIIDYSTNTFEAIVNIWDTYDEAEQ